MDMNQMMQMMMLLNGGNTPAPSPAPAPAPAAASGTRITVKRTANIFKRQSDGRWMISAGDITAPWRGPAQHIKPANCVKGEKCYTTKTEWELTFEVSQYGRVRVVAAEDTGIEYVASGDFDKASGENEFDAGETAPDNGGAETL